jgi:predicted nucleic acid-binding Zn ribbon protein
VPVYVYRRRDGSTFELEQRMTVDALVICPTTGQAVERVMQRFSPRYTGAGFYSTDHPKAMQPANGTDRGRAASAGRDQSSAPAGSTKRDGNRGCDPSLV